MGKTPCRLRENEYKKRIIKLLEQGADEYDYLRGVDFSAESMSAVIEQVGRLLGYLLKEKRGLEEKYMKLLELHNNLVETGGKDSERYSAEYIYKLADENELLRKELNALRSAKL